MRMDAGSGMTENNRLHTPLKKVRGLGSAKDGTAHWLWQRVTALVLIPTTVWFVFSLMHLIVGSSHENLMNWMAAPWNALMLLLFVSALFYHARLGMQVVIEDYVHRPKAKYIALFLSAVCFYGLALISVLSILRLHFVNFSDIWSSGV